MKKALSVNVLEDWLKHRKDVSDSRQVLILEGVIKGSAPSSLHPSAHGAQASNIIDQSRLYNALQTIDSIYANCLLVTRYLNDIESPFENAIAARSLGHQQGFEYDVVVLDCMAGWHPNQLYNSAGLVKASGLLVLLTPAHSNWPEYFASQTQIKFSYGDTHKVSYFSELLLSIFNEDKQVAWWTNEKQCLPVLESASARTESTQGLNTHSATLKLSNGQTAVLEHVLHSWQRKTKSCHLVTGSRGRGKTTLLAKAIELSLKIHDEIGYSKLILCTPTPLQNDLIKSYMCESTRESKKIISIAPDQIDKVGANDVLFIDEAASIAPWMLTKLCQQAAHALMCSTMQGYEGSGKGLLYRWLPSYEGEIVHHQLEQAFRWRANDPLEQLMDNLFLPQPLMGDLAKREDTKLGLHKIDKQALVNDPDLYRTCFALLQNAHYQSTPIDHMRMLDAQDNQLWVYANQNEGKTIASSIVGIICTIEEGGANTFSDAQLIKDIAFGQRRLQGHMTIQALALHLAEERITSQMVYRIHRIAVQANMQKQGIGSAMLRALSKQSGEKSEASLSAAFGVTDALHGFWSKNDFTLVKMGQRKDSSSGALTGYYVKTNSQLHLTFKHLFEVSLQLDLNYLKHYQKALYMLIPLVIQNLQTESKIDTETMAYITRKLNLFLCDKLSYTMVKSLLLFISGKFDDEKLLSLLEQLHTKHLHKHEKERLAIEIKERLNPLIVGYS
jgi:tRNA(Met) cytidine acetyltransferase